MSNKFVVTKYAAVASAVALACSSAGALAGSIGLFGTNDVTVSGSAANGAAAATADLVQTGNFSVALAANYAVNDTIVISVAGGLLRSGSTAATPSMTCYVTGAAAGGSTLLASFVSKTSSAVTYRVTGGTGLENSSFSCLTAAAGYSLTRNSLTSTATSGVTLSLTSYINGGSTAFDAQTTANRIHRAAAQFSAIVSSSFGGTVDIATGRLAWQGSTAALPAVSQSMTLTLSGYAEVDTATGLGSGTVETANLADAATVTANASIFGSNPLKPMFAWLDDDGNGCTADDLTTGPGSASVTSGGTLSISANCATLSWSFPAAVGQAAGTRGRTVTVTLSKATSSTGLALQDGVFSVAPSFTVTNAQTSTQTITTRAAGNFTLNGSVINIPYLPYGNSGTSAITQSILITNTSTLAGAVTGTARNQAGVLCNMGTVGTAAAQSVTNISAGINAAIASCYGTAGVITGTEPQRIYMDLVSNTDQGSTFVNATYNVGGNSRVQVTNDSNTFRTKQ